jgi:hypothetical protein
MLQPQEQVFNKEQPDNEITNNIFFTVFVIFQSCKNKVDLEYIQSKEWLSESGKIIRFYDKSEVLINDTIFQDNEPYAIIRSLDKERNQMTIFSISKHQNFIYTNTEEFTK